MAKSATTFLSCISIFVLIGFLFYADNHFNDYTLRIINLIAINAILAISLNLIYGFTGMFSLGHAGFMAIGAYICAILLLSPEQKEMMWILEPIAEPLSHLQLPFFVAVVVSGLCAAIIGLLIALPILRLGGDYLGIATLGFAEIIRIVITNATSFTNGSLGIKGIPQNATLWWNYGWLAFTVLFIVLLLRSNTGNVLRAIRDDEIAAKTMGINAFFYRSFSFTVGAFFAGIGGALMAALISTIDPKMFNFLLTFNILMIVVAGGLGSITGSIIGSIIITVMLEWLRIIESPFDIGFIHIPETPGLRMVIFSLLLLIIILFWRKGLMGQREFSWNGIYSFLTRKKFSNTEGKL
ncbi:branched-chain amino acid ABC transporter permease [Bartonella kosoyi]|uniref:Branched-chain amino acid ABC transporter permease n=1 Tax=Bartonella kosoyi TaxID=2133959 RepID=A0A5B9CY34_9HYPH|nr:branched-chain amino acid ABC transporter permease [Bartonella kosoyi]QEE09331.1 branched-chain amino acid ABC transporter permease [Bartonella kosoyi]